MHNIRQELKSLRYKTALTANPFKFTKELQVQEWRGELVCSKEETDHHLRQTYSGSNEKVKFGRVKLSGRSRV